jgi:hypothetical protein
LALAFEVLKSGGRSFQPCLTERLIPVMIAVIAAVLQRRRKKAPWGIRMNCQVRHPGRLVSRERRRRSRKKFKT